MDNQLISLEKFELHTDDLGFDLHHVKIKPCPQLAHVFKHAVKRLNSRLLSAISLKELSLLAFDKVVDFRLQNNVTDHIKNLAG